ncbi:hypothetical protein HAX54_046818, partial [Datura stramonium]|nr:hypothetical protein [Datura stramonium]
MESPYNPWKTSGVHKRKQRKVRDKVVPSLHISTYWLGADSTIIITKPDRDTEKSCGFPRDRLEFFAKFGGVGKITTIFILNLAPSQDINDQNGINCSITEVGISHTGLITKVLYNLMLDDFDRGFKELYPSLSYYRYLADCYILFPLFSLQSEQQCEEEMNSILLELDLDEDITTILPGGGAHVT